MNVPACGPDPWRTSLARQFQAAASVSRAALYGAAPDGQMPLHLPHDARLAFVGCCAPAYVPGAPLLLGINPGGGGDAYQRRTAQDDALLPWIEALPGAAGGASASEAFANLSQVYLDQMRRWNLWRIVGPVLDAAGCSAHQIAYLNAFAFRTRGDRLPWAEPQRRYWQLALAPLLAVLRPGLIVALGKKAGRVVQRYHEGEAPLFVVPRTIGDARVSAEAAAEIAAVKAHCRARRTVMCPSFTP